jgi:hypothetical protein
MTRFFQENLRDVLSFNSFEMRPFEIYFLMDIKINIPFHKGKADAAQKLITFLLINSASPPALNAARRF